ncbi:MAG: hypothetical protein ACTHJ4_00250 [Candidatus Nucleicultricaceae bacterium]
MKKMSLITLGLLGSMIFGSCVEASNMILDDDIIREDSVFIKGSFYQYSKDPKNLSEDLDPGINIGMRFRDVVAVFKKAGSVGATFFESPISDGSVSDEGLEELSAVAPYIHELYFNTRGLGDHSLVVLPKFTELRSLDLLFNSITTPSVEFFQHFPHLKEVRLNRTYEHQRAAVEKLKLAFPHIAFNPGNVTAQ